MAAAIATSPDPDAKSSTPSPRDDFRTLLDVARERLPARPGEGPERRRQADFAQVLLGLAPELDRLVGEMELQIRRERRTKQTRVLGDEPAAVCYRAAHVFQCSAEISVNSRRAVGLSISTLSASRVAIKSAPSLCSAVRSRSIASIWRGLAVRMAA